MSQLLNGGYARALHTFTGTMEDFAQNIKVLQNHVEGVVTCAKDGLVRARVSISTHLISRTVCACGCVCVCVCVNHDRLT